MLYNKTVIYNEPGDEETLRFSPSFIEDYVSSQFVVMCPVENEVSFIISQHVKGELVSRFIHLHFSLKEIDMLIESLKKSKEKAIKLGDEQLEKEKLSTM